MSFYLTTTPVARRIRPQAWHPFQFEVAAEASGVYFPLDVMEGENEYVISALLPGIKADDVNIQVVNDTLSISGEIDAGRDENASYLLQERPEGSFSRTLTLEDPLDADNIKAELVNGVLTLHVPKSEAARPKKISVKAS